ncbi:hypothetical protein AEQ18_10095 [Enterococcus sp. RIT-PI-f]|nr:hypothetical protein AEQ18_10095 [Enterococcus sp. RIT-PI-f]
MTNKQWFKIRKWKKIEIYICLLVVLPMVYGLWFNIVFLVQYMTFLFCIAVLTAIYELGKIIFEKIKKDN